MADLTEKILLTLELSSGKLQQELGKVRGEQKLLQAAQRDLNKELAQLAVDGKKGTVEYAALQQQIGKTERELVGLNRQAQELNKNLDANEAAAGSYNEMAATTAVLQKRLKEAAVGVNITAEAYEELTQQVEAGLFAQREFARSSGDMRALVGAYKEELGPSIEAVASKLGVANDSLAAMQGLLKELKAQQASISPVGDEATLVKQQIEELEAEIEKTRARLTDTGEAGLNAARSLTALREKLAALKNSREDIEPGTKAMGDLNAEILGIQTTILEAEGKIDEFGEKVQKNSKREDIDTVSDAFGGVVASIGVATLFMGDNANAAELEAKAMRAVAVAQNLRAIQIGIASAKDAAGIIVTQVRNVLFAKQTAALAANTVATEAAAVATETQATATGAAAAAAEANAVAIVTETAAKAASVAATEGATVAQEGLNLAMTLNPIGIIIVAIAALVVGFLAFRNASDATKKKVLDITETVLRFGTPIGLVITLLQKLYEKFAFVRSVIDPITKLLGQAVSAVGTYAQKIGESIGLLDTAAEDAAEAQKKVVDAIGATAKAYELQAKQLELAGAKSAEYRAKERQGLAIQLQAQQQYLKDLQAVRDEQTAGGGKQSEAATKELQEVTNTVLDLQNQLTQFDIDTKAKLAAEEKAAADARKKARDEAKKLLEEQLKLERERLTVQLGFNQLKIDKTKEGSDQELKLLQERAKIQRDIELANYGLTSEAKKLIQAKYQAELNKLNVNNLRAQNIEVLEQTKVFLAEQIAVAGEGSQKQIELKRQQVGIELQLELAALDARKDNTNKEAELRAAAYAKVAELDKQAAAARQQVVTEAQQVEITALKQTADLMLAGLNDSQRQQVEASEGLLNIRRAALEAARDAELQQLEATQAARVLAAGENTAELERINNAYENAKLETQRRYDTESLNLEAETAAKSQAIQQAKYQAIAQLGQDALSTLATIQQAQSDSDLAAADAAGQRRIAIEGTTAAKREQIEKETQRNKERLEKEAAEKRRKLAIVQALIAGGMAVMNILQAPTAPFIEPFASVVRAVQIGLVVATTAAQVAAMRSQKFAGGGVVYGPSHQAGGVQMYHRNGAHLGEMEGNEIVLTRGVFLNPTLRRVASALNVAGGGAPFDAGPLPAGRAAHLVAGGVVRYEPGTFTGNAQTQAGPAFDYATLGGILGAVVIQAVQALPPSQVAVSEITAVQQKVTAAETAADI